MKIRRKKKMSKLIKASSKTKEWIKKLRELIKKNKLPLDYGDSEHYASFKSQNTSRNIAYLNPTENQIRIFTRLPPTSDSLLKITPSKEKYAKMYPSIFTMNSKNLLKKAVELIKRSYEYDLTL